MAGQWVKYEGWVFTEREDWEPLNEEIREQVFGIEGMQMIKNTALYVGTGEDGA